jgi:hypothetical protein
MTLTQRRVKADGQENRGGESDLFTFVRMGMAGVMVLVKTDAIATEPGFKYSCDACESNVMPCSPSLSS